ncbi:secreted RxLR effector protein 78-like [Cryptomeria japonica]|uniref:secreted RxLR effector protein 78-like n=1 Tax=Cryptomeria japonica TaxID=3369 RepID=UPI0027DA46D8|nr:secreted RxLR effector protein 78-like [Cryptomeria japonica]
MDWAKVSGQNAAMFLLDFEKAYDRVEWEFILMMLEAFGFLVEFYKWVKILLKDASAQVEINGSLSQTIKLNRSIRQGCPLAPALFVIVAGALYYILRDFTISPKVEGVKLPNGSELINSQLADDTTLFIELTKQNMEAFECKIKFLGEISGAKISQAESTMPGWKEQPP